MSRKEILIIFLIICCLFSLQAVAAASDGNSTDDVVLTTDSNVSAYSLPNLDNQLQAGSEAGTFSDLQNDISNGKLERNYTYGSSDSGLANGITIAGDVTIDGDGKVTIDAKNQARVFNIASGATVTIKGITFINGNAAGNGGSISSSGVLTLIDCKFINNTAEGHGGAVYMDHSTSSTIENCVFNDNVAGLNGGAIDWRAGSENGKVIGSTFTNNTAKRSGGAIHWSGHFGTISSSNFMNNKATGEVIDEINGVVGGGDGGAVLWVGSHGIVKDNCNFTNNSAKYRGGAIFLHGNSTENCTNTTVTKSYFEDNVAGLNGGAIDWQNGTTNGMLSYSTFINNTALRSGGAVYWFGTNGTISYCNFTDNHALGTVDAHDHGIVNYPTFGGNGGAVLWTGSIGKVEFTNFTNNGALHNGGAVYLQSSVDNNCTNTTFTDCIFESNAAGLNGGAIDWHEGATEGGVYNSKFHNNTANGNGGAIFWSGHNGEIHYSNFTNNIAKGLVTDSYGNTGDGGAIIWSGTNGTVTNCWFVNNSADRRGGAVYLQNSTYENCTNTTFEYVYFINNTAGTNGGAIDWHEGAHDGHVYYAIFEQNTAKRSGGAIYWNGNTGEIKHSNFTNNKALGINNASDAFGNITYGGDGGAVIWIGSEGTVDNCTFIDNEAAKRGGAVYLQGNSKENCNDTNFTNSRFENNIAGTNGGAIDWNKGAHNGLVENVTFVNNTARRSGGAIYWNGNTGRIKNSNFTNNTALGVNNASDAFGNITYGGDGGAVIWIGSEGTVDNCIFVDNEAAKRGGAVYLQGSSEGFCDDTKFINSHFENNVAGTNGGAVDWNKGAHNGLVENVTFVNNTAKRSGGAIYWNGNTGRILSSNFTDNKALGINNASDAFGNITYGGDGGAVIWIGSDGTVDNCIFIDNEAAKRGGAVYLQGSSDGYCNNTKFINSLFENNVAGTNGGAIDWNKGAHNGLVENVTFINNTAKRSGGAIFWNGHNGTINHTRFYDNHALGIANATNVFGEITYGGNGGALMWSGAMGNVLYSNFANNTASKHGGAVYLQGSEDENSENTHFTYTYFINNTAGVDGGAIAFEVGVTEGFVDHSVFINNTATRNGGAINFLAGSSGGHIYNSTFDNNTAKRSGGAFYWEGNNGTVMYCNFTNNRAVGTTLEYDMVLTYENIVVVNKTLPTASDSTIGKLYIVDNSTDENHIHYISYVSEKNGDSYTWVQLDEARFVYDTYPSPTDWGMDQFFGGNGGTILWGGDVGIIDHCIITGSNSARRGGGAYMRGSNNITFSNCEFANDTSGTNGGALDWLAGANYGKVINCTFEDNRAARSAGTIYYDGDYGEFVNITIKNSYANGGALKVSRDGLVHYAGWDSSHWDTNTTGGDAGAIMITGNHVYIYNATFTNCTAVGRGGAVFLQDNDNVTFDLCVFEDNTALGTANNTWNDDKDLTSKLNKWHTGHGGAIAFDTGATESKIKNSKFINNTAERDGGAIAVEYGSSNITIYNSTFENNTAKRSGGAFAWNGNNGNISYSNFTGNAALGITLDTDHVNLTSLSQVVSQKERLPFASLETLNKLYVLVTYDINEEYKIKYELYVTVVIGQNKYDWLKHTETDAPDPSPTDWAIDEYFGGDGGSILWGGDNGVVDHCIFIDSNSARRGGGAYMQGSDNITYSNCYFENDTSGTNGGGLDWLAGANYGKVINCTFNNTKAARSAGAIYYDGDYGEMVNITIINTTANGGSLKESKDGRVKYAGWDSSHWDTNTTGGDAGAIMFTGDNVYVYNATFINCTAVGRGGAVFLQDNENVTFELCTFENNRALGIANNTWKNYTQERNDANNDTKIDYKLTGHGGAIAFDVGAEDCTIKDSKFINNTCRRDGGAINFAVGAINNTIENSLFVNNTAEDDGGAINWEGNEGKISNITCIDNKGTSQENSSSRGGAICITGNDVLITGSNFTSNTVIYSEGSELDKIDGGAIFITGNNVNITDSVFSANNATHFGGTIYIIGNNTIIDNCSIEKSNAINGSAIYVDGNHADIHKSTFTDNWASEDGGAIFVNGDDCDIMDSILSHNIAKDDGGAIMWRGNRGIVINITCYNNTGTSNDGDNSSSRGGAICLVGSNVTISKSNFTANTVIYNDGANITKIDGGALFITGDNVNIADTVFDSNYASHYGGTIYLLGHNGYVLNCTIENTNAINGGGVYIEGDNNTVSAKFKNTNASLSGGSIFVEGYNATIIDSVFDDTHAFGSNDNGGGAIYVHGDYTDIIASNFTYNYANNNHEARGGAIYVNGFKTTIRDSNFEHSRSNLYGGSIYINGTNTTVIGSEFTDCTVNSLGSQGGAIYVNGNYTDIEDSTFTQNTAKSEGGAIYVNGEFADIMNSVFEENTVEGPGGGAIYVEGDYAIIEGSNFTENKAIVDANAKGGAIDVSGEHAIIRDSNFVDCSAKLDGGAIYINGDYTTVAGSNFTRSTVQDSNSGGGAIYVSGEYALIEGSNFVDSSAKLRGGAIYIHGDYTTVRYSTFTNSTVTTPRPSGSSASKSRGGAIYLEGNYCNVTNSSFIDSYSAQDGGAIFSTGSYSNVLDSNFTNNVAREDGGAIFWHGAGNSKNNVVDGCVFTNNTAYAPDGTQTIDGIRRTTRGGGAIYWSEGGSYGVVKNSQFYNNSVQSAKNKADGGAVLWDKSSHGILDNCTFVGNYVKTSASINDDIWVQGGALFLRARTNFTIIDCEFINSTSSKEAGALYLAKTNEATSAAPQIRVINTKFINNVADAVGKNINGGGAIQVKDPDTMDILFKNVTFINNAANKGGAVTVLGVGSNVVFDGCNFIGNNATEDGGNIWSNKAFELKNSLILNGTAKNGGGLYINEGNVVLNNLTFEHNKAEKGSAIYSKVAIVLEDVSLLKNRANSASFDVTIDWNNKKITLDFKGWDNYLNAIYLESSKTLTCTNVTYLNEEGIVNTGKTQKPFDGNAAEPTLESGQNFTFIIGDHYGNQLNKGNDIFSTNANGHIELDLTQVLPAGTLYANLFADVYLTNEDYYTYVEKTTRIIPTVEGITTNATFHMNGTLDVFVTKGAIGNVSVYYEDTFLGNITLVSSDVDSSKGSMDISTLINGKYLEVGNHTLVLKYSGDGVYKPVEGTAILNVTKANTNILFNVTPVGYDFIINVTVIHNETGIVTDPNDVTGNVTVNVRGQDITVVLVNGSGVCKAYNLPIGPVNITATYHGDNNYYASTNITSAEVKERIRTTISIEVSAYDIMVDETIVINITVIAGDDRIVNGNITVVLDNVEYSVQLNNSKASFNKTGLSAGVKYVVAMFSGDEDLAPSASKDNFTVHKYPAFVLIEDKDVPHGSDELINITVPDDANGTVTVFIEGEHFIYYHVLEIENGTVTIPLKRLDVGEYNVTASFENDKYEYTINNSTFNVNKLTPPIIITADNIVYGEEAVITVFVEGAVGGNVTLKINDDLVVFVNETLVNDLATFSVKYLPVGEYKIDVDYSGDESDNRNDAQAIFYVEKADPTIEVVVEDIYYGDIEYIYINVNANGTVLVKVDGTETNITLVEGKVTPVHVLRAIYNGIPLDVFDGKAEERVHGLQVGNYPVEVFYSGNHNYKSGYVKVDFNVMKIDTVLDVYVQDSLVWDSQEIEITVLDTQSYPIMNATGNITLNINGVDYTAEVNNSKAVFHLDDLTVGHKTLWVFYDGDRNLNGNRTIMHFEVKQRTPVVNVTALNVTTVENGKITVNIPVNATGYVIVSGNFTDYQIRVDNFNQGIAEIPIEKLTNGTYSVHIKYYGESYDNYTIAESDTTFKVSKANAALNIVVQDIAYGEKANITVNVPDGAEGYITIRINNTQNVTLPIVNGKVNWIVDGLASENYTVYANYSGDARYNISTANKTFKVNKATSSLIIETPEEVDAATNATIVVRIDETATGNITITVNGTKYNATIVNGVATFTIDKLLSGKYDITAEYAGDGNNTAAAAVTLAEGLTVNKVDCYQINVTANDTKVDLNTTIVVKVPGDATGNVSIYVDGVFVGNATIYQGIAQLNVTKPYGNHTINATFSDGKYGPRYAVWDYWVFKHESPLVINVDSIVVGDKAYINVTAPSDNVTIEINGKSYNKVKYENGVAYFEVSDLGHGNKTVVAIYGGSEKYVQNTTTKNFTASKRNSFIKVNVTNSTVGSGAFINVTVPSDAAGYVIVTVNNTNYTINLVGGKGNVTIYNLKNNTYDVVVTYIGDEKYLLSTNSSSFNVSKVESSINITISHFGIIGNGSDADITVEVPADATGKVEITVAKQFESKTYTIYVNEGKGVLHLETPEIGLYNVTAKYLGDDKYIGSENKSKLDVYINGKELFVDTVPTTVAEKESITVWAEGSHVGDNLTITIRDNAGKVILKQNVTFSNYRADYNVSWAVLQIGPLPAGDYSVDGLYIEIDGVKEILHSGNNTFKVSKLRSTLSIKEIRNITVGEDAVIEFILDPSVTDGNVYVFVNGIEYNLTSSDLTLTIPNLRDGEYHVRAFYEGDYNYSQSNASAVFKVSKVNPQITVNATNITVGEKVLIEITAPKDVTLPVLVDVDGVGYYVNITSGKGQLYVPYLASGNYTVVVRYSGDDKYNETQNATEFKVSKVSSTVDISVDDITVGDKAIIKVQTPKDLCGNVTVSVDGENHTVFVSGGEGTLVIADLAVGPHNVEVTFDGCKKYEPSNNTAKFNVNKVKTTEADIKVIDQGNGTVLVVVPNNATGNVTLKVGDKEFNATVVNGTAVVELDNVAPGNHEVDVIYSGDGNYNSTSTKANITAPKYDSPIDIEIGEITAGENGTIVVKLPADAAGNVTVSVDGKVYNATVVGGEAIVNVGNLTAGPKTVVVEYSGDGNYTSGYAVGNFTVEPAMIDPDISVVDYGNGTVVVVVPGDANGNVTITVDGKDYVAEVVNGTAVVELDDVTPGTHHVDVVYSGDDKYSNITKTTDITAPKYDSPIDITVAEIKSGENGTIVVKLSADAAGNVTVSVDGKVYNATVVNGEAIVNVGNLTAGPKTVVVEYSGDGNYTSAYAVGNFTVEQSKVAPDVTVVDQGNGTIVVVVPNDATGNVTVKVGDNIYNADVVNGTATITLDGLTPGENNIEVIYNGDDTYTNTTFSSVVTGPKYDAPIEIITVPGGAGEDTVITVKVPENATGNATIEIDGVKYTAEIKNGNATFRINNLTAGTKTMVVGYDGDDNYAGKHIITNVTVSKIKSTVSAKVTDINVGENVTITVFVPEDATGQVLIDIDGVGYYVNVTKGTGTIQIPRMPNGIYKVNLTYVGDDKYLPSNNAAVFDVNKLPSYVIPKATNIAVGENEIIVFEVPSDATGNLTVVINGENFIFDLDEMLGAPIYDNGKFSVAVSGGKGILVLSGLPKGTYEVTVTYNGNYKYLKSSNTTVFNVFESSCDVDVVDLGNGTVKVYVSDNATGNVTVKVQGQTYTAEVRDGVAVINLDDVSSGTHDIEVTYSGDNDHAGKTVHSTVSIPKRMTPISVSAHDIYVEDTEHIVVTVPDGATGIVTIEINSISYDAVIKNGKAIFDVTGLTAGKKTIAVIYWGDDNYVQNFTTEQFEVKKHSSTAKASSKNIQFGKDETISINFPKDATGRVTVKINGMEYSGEIINGKVKIVIPNLPPGNYKAIVTYDGDDKYLPTSTTTSFNVAKAKTKMSAKADHIDVGDDATIVVKLPKDATGKVTIVVDGKKYTTNVVNGKAIFYIPGLDKGAHNAIIFYSGDGKYDARKTITTVFVHGNGDSDKNEAHGDAEHDSVREDGILLSDYPTGNPIFVLLLLILAAGATQIRRFRR